MNFWIFITLIAVLVILLLTKKTREQVVGICSAAFEQTAQKNERKAKILELLAAKGELSNSDIRDALGISGTSAVRYTDELEKEGKVVQVGSTGHAVTYRLK